jgi:hypothetical protein
MHWFIQRLTEGSTHAGLAAILQAVKYFVPPPWGAVIDAGTLLFGSVAVAIKN